MNIKKTVLVAFGLAASVTGAQAQDWPSRPITMIVPYNPGGTTDILARLAAEAIAQAVGQPVIVENKPGAGGVVGASLAAQAPNDGYTIFFGNNATNVVQPLINPAVQYDPAADFDGIATTADAASFIGVNADLGIETLDEFIAWLGANRAMYGTAGVGSMGQFTAELFLMETGTEATHIPYPGSNDAMAAVMSGEIAFMMDPVVAQQAGSGRINVIAALTPERHPNVPDVPTATELGHDVVISGWFGVFAPDGTDPALIAAMSAPLQELVASDSYRAQVLSMGLLPNYRDPAAVDAVVEQDLETFGRIRDAAAISIN